MRSLSHTLTLSFALSLFSKAEAAAMAENTAVTDMDYMEDKRGGGAIDAKAGTHSHKSPV